jgi:hypothetical protein
MAATVQLVDEIGSAAGPSLRNAAKQCGLGIAGG